ncbi:hypothetical protein ATI61_10614 [Archangium gephyra]|uniref:Peptidase, M23/M37 family n=1 Tax=Archangium gephyra TaxID=48 RepID=A0AAC8Q0B1_9BACT|nr:hypothetical protein [Archangium gephyra]AKI98614.1 Peptidase, M23/M37 family [Archangium gephyra]REG30545.1 hypothetical protein ATI61_10614 [Archangium gephyra]
MRHSLKHSLAALASLAILPTATAATRVGSPIDGTVTNTTYYSSGSFHGSVDIAGQCNDPVRAPFPGYWNVTIQTTGTLCLGGGSGSGNYNEAKHGFGDGLVFRIRHFIKTDKSYDRTCEGNCVLGLVGDAHGSGPGVHLQLDKNGTLLTSWYSGYTARNEFLSFDETVGYI